MKKMKMEKIQFIFQREERIMEVNLEIVFQIEGKRMEEKVADET